MIFDWCLSGQHKDCKREFTKYYFEKKLVMTDEVIKCDCPKRGCACYTPPAERKKPVKRKRKS